MRAATEFLLSGSKGETMNRFMAKLRALTKIITPNASEDESGCNPQYPRLCFGLLLSGSEVNVAANVNRRTTNVKQPITSIPTFTDLRRIHRAHFFAQKFQYSSCWKQNVSTSRFTFCTRKTTET